MSLFFGFISFIWSKVGVPRILIICTSWWMEEVPGKIGSPRSISAMTQPSKLRNRLGCVVVQVYLRTRHRWRRCTPSPRRSVPVRGSTVSRCRRRLASLFLLVEEVRRWVPLMIFLADPKSHIFSKCDEVLTSTFYGLISRWVMPSPWI